MNNIDLIVGILQWGIFFFFVIINLLIGFKRGTKKTLYYTVVSIFLTIVLFFGISFVSINMFFKSTGRIIHFVEAYVDIPVRLRNVLVNPDLSPFLFAILDIVFKFIVYLLLYTPLKFFLTKLVFKPIYKTFFERRRNERISAPSRVGGAIIGSLRGVFVTIMVLLPLIIISQAFNQYESSDEVNTGSFNYQINDGNNNEELTDEDRTVEELLTVVQSFNKEGIGSLSSKLKFKGGKKSFDVFLFDLIYQTNIKDKHGNKTKVYLSDELNSYGKVGQILIEEGYLNKNFDYKTINYDDNYKHIDLMLESLSDSDLINIIIPYVIDVVNDEGILEEQLGFNPKTNIHTKKAYESIYELNFKSETNHLNDIIKEMLLIGSVGELMDMANDPEMFLELDQSEKQRLGEIFKYASNLEIVKLSNILVEYFINEQLIDQIDWEENPDEYIHEQLEFIFSDITIFQDELYNMGDIILNVFKDEYSEFDYRSFVKNKNVNYETLLKEEAANIVSEVIKGVANSKVTTKNIPVLVDFLVYTSDNDVIANLADELSNASRDQDYKDEFENIDSVYSLAVTLGLESLLGEDNDNIEIIDEILQRDDNFETVKDIVNILFEDSKAVNDVLEIVSEPLINEYVENEDVKDMLIKLVNSEDFKYGEEVVNLLNILEQTYTFTDLKTLTTNINDENYVKLMNDFGSINELEFEELKELIYELQTLNVLYIDLLNYANNNFDDINYEIPLGYSYDDFKVDADILFGLGFETSKLVYENDLNEENYKDFNIAENINYERFEELLTFNIDDHEKSIVLSLAINNLIDLDIDLEELGTITVPEELDHYDVSEEWISEINNLTNGLLNVLKSFSDEDEEFIISINNLSSVKSLKDIETKVVTRYKDEELTIESFETLFESKILNHNVINMTIRVLENNDLPDSIMSEDVVNSFKGENYSKTITLAARLLDKLNDDESENIEQTLENATSERLMAIFNNLNEEELDYIAYSPILLEILREAATNEDVHIFAYDKINQLNLPEEFSNINSGLFDFTYALDADGKIDKNTLKDMLLFVQKLYLPTDIATYDSDLIISTILNSIDDDSIDRLFNVKVLHELLSNVVKLNEVKNYGSGHYSNIAGELSSLKIELDSDYEDVYNVLLTSLLESSNNLLDKNEFKGYLSAYKTFDETGYDFKDINDGNYNRLAEALLKYNIDNKNTKDYLSELKSIRGLMGLSLNDNGLHKSLSLILNDLDKNDEFNLNIDPDLFKLDNKFFDNVGLKEEYLNQFLTGVLNQDLNIISRKEFTVEDLVNLIDESEDVNKLNHLYNIEIITYLLETIVTSEELNMSLVDFLNMKLDDITESLEISNHRFEDGDVNLSYDFINYDATYKIIDIVKDLNINNFSELNNIRTTEEIIELLDLKNDRTLLDKATSIDLLYYVFETSLSHDIFYDVLADLVDTKILSRMTGVEISASGKLNLEEEYINHEEFSNLIIALLGSGLNVNDDFTNPQTLSVLLDNVRINNQNIKGIEHVLNSNIVYSSVDNILQSEDLIEVVVDKINESLEKQDVSARVDKEQVKLPTFLLDDHGRIQKQDYINALMTFNSLNLDSYSQLSNLADINSIKELVTEDVFDNLFEVKVIHYTLSSIFQSEQSRDVISKIANEMFENRGIDYKITKDSLIVPNELLDENNLISKDDFKIVFEAAYMVDYDNFDNINIVGLTDIQELVDMDVPFKLLDSNLIHYVLSTSLQSNTVRAILSSELNELLKNNSIDVELLSDNFIIPDEYLNEDSLISKDDFRSMIEIFYEVKIDNFKQIDINNPRDVENIVDVVLLEKILEVDLLNYAVTKLLQSNSSREIIVELVNNRLENEGINRTLNKEDLIIPNELLDDGLIKKADILIVADTFYNLGIDDFKNINIKGITDIEEIINLTLIDNLLTSELVHYVISKGMLSEELRAFGANEINKQLSSRLNLESKVLKEDFNIPSEYLEDDLIKKSDMLLFVELLYDTKIEDFRKVDVDKVKDIIDTMDREVAKKVFNNDLANYILYTATQSESSRSILAELANKELDKRNIDVELTKELLLIPDHLLNSMGHYEKEDLRIFKNVATDLLSKDLRNFKPEGTFDFEELFSHDDFNYLLSSNLAHYIISTVALDDQLKEVAAQVINSQLKSRGFDTRFEASDFNIPSEYLEDDLIKVEDMLLGVEFVYGLNIENIKTFRPKSLDDIKSLVSKEVADELLENDLANYILYASTQKESARSLVVEVLNKEFNKRNINLVLDKDDLLIEDKYFNDKGYYKNEDLKTLIKAVNNLGINSPSDINFKDYDSLTSIISLEQIEEVLNVGFVHFFIDKATKSEQLKSLAVNYINPRLDSLVPGLEIKTSYLELKDPSLDDDGMISVDEIMIMLDVAYSLNINNLDDLRHIKSVEDVKEIIPKETVEKLLTSKTAYYAAGYVTQTDKFREVLAKATNKILEKYGNINSKVTKDIFLLNEDTIVQSGEYKDYINFEELETLIDLLYLVDTSFLGRGNVELLLNNMFDELVREENNELIIEHLLKSKIVHTVVDRSLDINAYKEVEDLYAEIINKLNHKLNLGVKINNIKELLTYHSSAFDENNMISKDEIVKLVIALDTVDITRDISPELIIDLLDRNVDENNNDDFDRVFNSIIVRSVISNVINDEAVLNIVSDKLNDTQNKVTLSANMFKLPEEVYEDGLIKVDELRYLFNAFNLLEINDFDLASLGLNNLTNLIGQNEENGVDDLDRLLQSFIIHSYIDRTINSETFEQLIAETLADIMKTNVDNVNLKPEKEQLDDNNMFSKSEIRSLLISTKLLGINDINSLDKLSFKTLLDLDNEDNELDVFLDSSYITLNLSRLFSSSTIREKLATEMDVEFKDFDLSLVEKDDNGNMTKEEVKAIFISLKILGIEDINNIEFNNETLKDLSNDEIDQLLESGYFYQIIDLKLKKELDDHLITEDALENGVIKKSEIKALINALEITEKENKSVQDLEDLIDFNSVIINNVITEEVEKVLEVPEDSKTNGVIRQDELSNLLEALDILGIEKSTNLNEIDFDEVLISKDTFSGLISLKTSNNNPSPLITRILSNNINEVFAEDVPSSAKDGKDLTHEELQNLNDVLHALNVLDAKQIEINKSTINELGEATDYKSLILRSLFTKEISKEINNLPESVYDEEDIIKQTELAEFMGALARVYGPNTLEELFDDKLEEITVLDIETLISQKSTIVRVMISNQMKEEFADDVVEEAKDENGHITQTELVKFTQALKVITEGKVKNVKDELENVTVSQIDEMNSKNSLIIDKLISNNIKEKVVVTKFERDTFDEEGNITKEEINRFINGLSSVSSFDGINDITNEMNSLEANDLRNLIDYNSLILQALMSDVLNDVLDITDDAKTSDGNIKQEELKSLIIALDEANIALLEELNTNDTKLETLNILISSNSIILTKMISDSLKNNATLITDNAPLDDNGSITNEEIANILDDLMLINTIDNNTKLRDLETIFANLELEDLTDIDQEDLKSQTIEDTIIEQIRIKTNG